MRVGEFVSSVMEDLRPFLVDGQAVSFDLRMGMEWQKHEGSKDTFSPGVGSGESRLSFTLIVGAATGHTLETECERGAGNGNAF